jgi:hypothetical protein
MTAHAETGPVVYGVLAEFDNADALINAAGQAHQAGYTRMDAYSPYPVGEVADAMGYKKSEMGPVMFIGGLLGATGGFLMQYWTGAEGFPINVGGRPFNSWPMFIPITFELMVLTAALSGLFGLMASCGLPQLYHPLFNVPGFDRASCDRFFLCIEAIDPKFEVATVRDFMAGLQPLSVAEVPE